MARTPSRRCNFFWYSAITVVITYTERHETQSYHRLFFREDLCATAYSNRPYVFVEHGLAQKFQEETLIDPTNAPILLSQPQGCMSLGIHRVESLRAYRIEDKILSHAF